MEGSPPEWLNKDFLRLAISDGERDTSKDNWVVRDFTVKPAVEAGNNYCTQLFRVKVEYEGGNTSVTKSFIIKAPLEDGVMAKSVISEAKLLQNEHIMYTKILPEIYAISKHEFGPRSYFCQEKDVLIMDDLNEKGYEMRDRLSLLDFQHCKRFIETLAKYHAATVALHGRDPRLVESNGVQPLYNEDMNNSKIVFIENIKLTAFVNILKNLEGVDTLAQTIQNHSKTFRDAIVKIFKRRGPINVLNHGDCWTNNILFKQDEEGSVVDCKLIDFQIRTYGSPATDLLYFMFTSCSAEVRDEHMDDLLQIYCDKLNKTLTELGCEERLSLQDLRLELKELSPWALHVVMNYLPMILNEPDQTIRQSKDSDESLKSLDINVNPALRVFLSKTYNAVLPNVCKDLIKLGVVEQLERLKN